MEERKGPEEKQRVLRHGETERERERAGERERRRQREEERKREREKERKREREKERKREREKERESVGLVLAGGRGGAGGLISSLVYASLPNRSRCVDTPEDSLAYKEPTWRLPLEGFRVHIWV